MSAQQPSTDARYACATTLPWRSVTYTVTRPVMRSAMSAVERAVQREDAVREVCRAALGVQHLIKHCGQLRRPGLARTAHHQHTSFERRRTH